MAALATECTRAISILRKGAWEAAVMGRRGGRRGGRQDRPRVNSTTKTTAVHAFRSMLQEALLGIILPHYLVYLIEHQYSLICIVRKVGGYFSSTSTASANAREGDVGVHRAPYRPRTHLRYLPVSCCRGCCRRYNHHTLLLFHFSSFVLGGVALESFTWL